MDRVWVYVIDNTDITGIKDFLGNDVGNVEKNKIYTAEADNIGLESGKLYTAEKVDATKIQEAINAYSPVVIAEQKSTRKTTRRAKPKETVEEESTKTED